MDAGQTISLADGRKLFAAAYGPADGQPVLYCHGTPSAHGEWELFGDEAMLARLNLRMIVPDRPGLGGSSFQRGRTLGRWPADAAAVLDAFGIGRFAVLGYSGGGAYAVATALAFADRVTALALVAPVIHAAPEMVQGLDQQSLQLKELTRTKPWLARIILAVAMGIPARFAPDRIKTQMLKTLPGPDRDVLLEHGLIDRFIGVLADAFRHGAAGPVQDMGLLVSPWDIALRKVPFPVSIWQGEADNFGARPAMARYLAAALGTRDLHLLPEGHISIFTRNVEAILAGLQPAA